MEYEIVVKLKVDKKILKKDIRGWLKGNLESIRIGKANVEKVTVPVIEEVK